MKIIPAPPVLTWLTLAALLVPTATGISFSHTTHAQNSEVSMTAMENCKSALSKYAVDLTQLAAQGELETLIGFDAEVDHQRHVARGGNQIVAGILLGDGKC